MDQSSKQALARALSNPRFEVVPLSGIDGQLVFAPPGATMTVTCSPSRGLQPTLRLTRMLLQAGHRAVPHLSARLVTGEAELRLLAGQMTEMGVREIFVIGGDARHPAGPYASALDLLRALSQIPSSIDSIGIAAYPEPHPLIHPYTLLEHLLEKQPFATHVVTQICFDAPAIVRWLASVRAQGVRLPVYVGLPGALDAARLLRISLKIGVGDSVRYLSKRSGTALRLLSHGHYRPDELVFDLAPHLADPALGIAGLHLNTFNQLESTEKWRRETLRRLNGEPGHREAV